MKLKMILALVLITPGVNLWANINPETKTFDSEFNKHLFYRKNYTLDTEWNPLVLLLASRSASFGFGGNVESGFNIYSDGLTTLVSNEKWEYPSKDERIRTISIMGKHPEAYIEYTEKYTKDNYYPFNRINEEKKREAMKHIRNCENASNELFNIDPNEYVGITEDGELAKKFLYNDATNNGELIKKLKDCINEFYHNNK